MGKKSNAIIIMLLGLLLVVHHTLTYGYPFDLNEGLICHGIIGLILMGAGAIYRMTGTGR
jgi:hypothetical protein